MSQSFYDSQEATQELAAKALSILFERCDASMQDQIVKELAESLATTRTASAAASGGEMATFTELSDIANNAGQPELVYMRDAACERESAAMPLACTRGRVVGSRSRACTPLLSGALQLCQFHRLRRIL